MSIAASLKGHGAPTERDVMVAALAINMSSLRDEDMKGYLPFIA